MSRPAPHVELRRRGDLTDEEMVDLVDFDEHLRPFYLGACRFAEPDGAGLIRLCE